jgi:light-independent protochlorophyllide reductase B subunit
MIVHADDIVVREPFMPGMINGSVRAVKCIQGAVPLLHASQGCQESLYFDGCFSPVKPRFCLREMTEEPYLPSTIVNEEDVIFGAEERLEDALEELHTRCAPELIAVLTSDAPEIIGDNITDVALNVSDRTACKILTVEAGNLNGDHIDGFRAVIESAVSQVMIPQPMIEKTVNLVGIAGDEVSSSFDVHELKRLLLSVGIQVNSVLLSDTSIQEIERAPAAALNIVLTEELGLPPAEMMEEQFNTPYFVGGIPYGVEGTSEWLLEIASILGQESEALAFVEKEGVETLSLVRKYERDINFRLEAAVSADPTTAVGFTHLLQELGFCVTLLTVRSPPGQNILQQVNGLDNDGRVILINPDYHQYKEMLKEIEDLEIVFGSFIDSLAAAEYGIPVIELFYPLMRMVEWEGPLMGFGGAVTMGKKLAKYCIQQWL